MNQIQISILHLGQLILTASHCAAQIPERAPSERYSDFHAQIEALIEETADDVVVTGPLYLSALIYYRDEQQAAINSVNELRDYLKEICHAIDNKNDEINKVVAARAGRTPTEEEIELILELKSDKTFCAFKGVVIPDYQGRSFLRNGAYLQELAAIEGRALRKRNFYRVRIGDCTSKLGCKNGNQPNPG